MNYKESLSYIHSLQVFGSIPGLERISELLEYLGNPQDELRFIHVAGTNGKGSTCTMLSEIYKSAGLKVGLYTSPYVVDFRERIQVNGKYIEKDDLARLCKTVRDTDIYVTEFEFITALAFLYFKEQNCDLVILEVGLGGRFDATNIIKNPLCSVITRIDLDHTDYLGSTYSEIASEKCGIIKDGTPTVVYPVQEAETFDTIYKYASGYKTPNVDELKILSSNINGNSFVYYEDEYQTKLVGEHQIYNALTAIETAKTVGMASDENIKEGIAAANIAARIELISENPLRVLDGSHNPNGADALARFMDNCSEDIVAVIGMMADKDCELFLQKILPYCSSAITVTVEENKRSISAKELADLAKKYCDDVISAESYDDALAIANEKSAGEKPIFVCGSLYLASAIREKLKKYN